MIDTTDLESCTGKVMNPAGAVQGTAFFVGADLLLTSMHVVEDFIDDVFYVIMPDKTNVEVIVKDHCPDSDLALLTTKGYLAETFVPLCNEAPVEGTSWASYGHPVTSEGQAVGTKLVGDIFHVITLEHNHDIVLRPHEIVLVKEYKGFSGSGVINAQKQVTSILRYKDNNTLCSVSVKKAEDFLKSNGVHIVEDQFNDFSAYISEVFQAVADPFKSLGIDRELFDAIEEMETQDRERTEEMATQAGFEPYCHIDADKLREALHGRMNFSEAIVTLWKEIKARF